MNTPALIAVAIATATMACADDAPVQTGSKVYVADEEGGTLSVIDHASRRRLRTIDLSEQVNGTVMRFTTHNVQVAPDGRSVWATAAPVAEGHVGHGGGGSGNEPVEQVVVIDPRSDTVVARIPVGSGLHLAHVVLDAASRYAYVSANEASQVLRIDATTRQVVGRYDLGTDRGPHGMRFCGERLYVANMNGHSLSVIDPVAGSVREVPVGGVAVQTACAFGGRYVFASLYDTREVVRLEVSTGVLTRISLPQGAQGPVQLYPLPDGRLYVCDQGMLLDRPASNKLFEVDVRAGTVVATIEVGRGAHGVVVSDDGREAFVTNFADNTVSIVDTATRRAVATVAVGESPNGVAHWHVTGGMP
ncbi:MAG: YncE family protein [Polyangiales bacterium]